MESIEQAPKSIFSKVDTMRDVAYTNLKNIFDASFNVITSKVFDNQDPAVIREGLFQVFETADLTQKVVFAGMKDRLLTFKNAPKEETTLH